MNQPLASSAGYELQKEVEGSNYEHASIMFVLASSEWFFLLPKVLNHNTAPKNEWKYVGNV